MLANNFLALIITFIVALLWLRINDYAAERGWVDSHLSRKLIHIGTGPLFVLCWLLFDDERIGRFLAALVPLMFTLQFLLIGIGVIKDEASVKAMSRTGDRREILRGPLYYGIIFVILTIIYWKDSPIGVIALMLLCGGDGLADIFGRKWGIRKIFWNKHKSYAGMAGMLIGGWLLSAMIVWFFSAAGIFNEPISRFLLPITIISIVSTIVETFPLKDLDNLTITLTSVILGHFFF
jgi:phytol kinase